MIRVVLAEDQAMLRGALTSLLSLESDIEIVAQADNGSAALRHVQRLKPDVLITDIEMPELTGLEIADHLKRHGPQTAVMIITTFARPGYLQRAVKCGVKGYMLKDAPSEDLANAVRKIARGGTAFERKLDEIKALQTDPLSERDRKILRLVEAGKTNKEIALALNLSAGTVRNYLSEALEKLGVSNRIEGFRLARMNGWL